MVNIYKEPTRNGKITVIFMKTLPQNAGPGAGLVQMHVLEGSSSKSRSMQLVPAPMSNMNYYIYNHLLDS